jgi:hypothetical protein
MLKGLEEMQLLIAYVSYIRRGAVHNLGAHKQI